MTLQSSGAISLLDIQNELGGGSPIGINEYYRGGAYTPSSISQVPASGTIAFSNFYGVSKANTQSGAITGSKSGGIRLWKWTSSGSFVIFNPGYIDILVVGGGGRGYWGYGYAGSGGGAGGLIYIPSLYLEAGNYTVTIGASGSDTILYKNGSIYLRALAGGGNPNTGGTGGSGSGDGGTSNQNAVGGLSSAYGYGNRGGYYSYADQAWNASGGGGGAGDVGGNGSGYWNQYCYNDDGQEYCYTNYTSPVSVGGNGGNGRYYSIDINGSYYAGGGGGASGFSDNVSYIWGYPYGYGNGYAIPYGGAGGGGRGTSRGEGNGSGYTGPDNGTNGLGGGGGGGGPGNANGYYTSGGSGVLIMSGSSSMLP
jgi:hypothetical protein